MISSFLAKSKPSSPGLKLSPKDAFIKNKIKGMGRSIMIKHLKAGDKSKRMQTSVMQRSETIDPKERIS